MTDDVAYLDTMDEVLIMAIERNLIAAGHLSPWTSRRPINAAVAGGVSLSLSLNFSPRDSAA